MATDTKQMTAEELFERSDLEMHCELIRGELVTMSPVGKLHGEISADIPGFTIDTGMLFEDI